MDRNIVGQALKNAKRLMNNAEFDRKVNGYVNEGAGADGYMPMTPSQRAYDPNYDPLDYTQMSSPAINSKLPKNILDSMLNNPINVTPANSGFGSVLGALDTDELERSVPAQMPRRRLNEASQPQQMPMMQPAGFDSNYLKFLVKEAVKECMEEMKGEVLNESTLKGLKIAGGNKIMLVDQKGNLFEATMQLKKKAQ